MCEKELCIYCNKRVDDYITTLCCHSIGDFIYTLINLRRMSPQSIDNFLRSQPYYLVVDSIIKNNPDYKFQDIQLDYYKIKKIIMNDFV